MLILGALLWVCHGNVELAELVYHNLLELEPSNHGASVLSGKFAI